MSTQALQLAGVKGCCVGLHGQAAPELEAVVTVHGIQGLHSMGQHAIATVNRHGHLASKGGARAPRQHPRRWGGGARASTRRQLGPGSSARPQAARVVPR